MDSPQVACSLCFVEAASKCITINIILELLMSNICIPKYRYGIGISNFLPKRIGIGIGC